MKNYWYFLLPAIILCLIPSDTIDKATKQWIPDDKKRAKIFLGILIGMAVFVTIFLFFVSENIPLGFRLPMCLFPVIALVLGFLIGKFVNKKK